MTEACIAFSAGSYPVASSSSITVASAWVSSHVTTSAIEAPDRAAAKRTGAKSFAAAAYQKSESVRVRLPVPAPSASHVAVRRAIAQSQQPSSGDQLTL